MLIINVYGTIPQNIGDQGLSISGADDFTDSSPQYVRTPSLSPSEIGDFENPFLQNVESASLSAGGLADSPWPMFRQNLNHTGLSPFDTSENLGIERWNFTTGGNIYSSPTIDSDGTIYIGSNDKKLYAINPDGTEKWNLSTNLYITSSPAIGLDGTIYVGSEDGKLYAINPDATEKWSFTTSSDVESSPAIDSDGTIYVGDVNRNLYAINPDGTEKWSLMDVTSARSSPAIGSDGTIYIGSWDGKLYAINPNGSEKWSFITSNSVHSSPAISPEGTIYVGSGDMNLYAVNPNGTEKWHFTTGSSIDSSPGIDSNGTIYIGSWDGKLYAINPDGTEKWSFITGNYVRSSPAIDSNGIIYLGSRDQKIYAINPDGTEKWNFSTDGQIVSSPSIGSDGTIYIGSNDNKLYAIGIPNTPPIANAGYYQIVYEGSTLTFNASASYDPDGKIESYQWDFDSSDGFWWETGAIPESTNPSPTHIYGDDGFFIATLRVTDNDNLSATDTCNITVFNVDPTVEIESATIQVEIGLRVAGRKFNDVGMTLFEDGISVSYISIERMPGSPNEQMTWIPITLDMTKTYSATMTYTPEDPPNIGGNPVWIYIKFSNGSTQKIHRNHIEPWEVDLNVHLVGWEFVVDYHIIDPGSDDEILTFSYGSQNVEVTYLNNPPNPDPYPSPEVNPRDIYGTTTLVYEGPGTLTMAAKDDDNIRLGVGENTDSINLL
jgi:outer membrane protein assembly factor BamB